jgi:hypothetical protein
MSSDGGIRSENRRRNEGRSSDPSPQHTSDDLEEKELAIPTDKMVPNGAKITINTGAE